MSTGPVVRAVGAIRENVRSRAHDYERRNRRPPVLAVDGAAAPPTIYYLTPHFDEPSGGVRVLYRHVDTLNSMGVRAAVLHAREGFRCTWFENQTRVVHPRGLVLHRDDVLVVPEYYGHGLDRLPPGIRVVVFNQNVYQTFDGLEGTDRDGRLYADIDNLAALMTVSQDSVDFLEFTFPGVPVWHCRPVIDPDLFHPGDQPRRRALAYVVARRRREMHHLLHMWRERGLDWDVVRIAGRSEREVAEIMREVSVFVSLSDREGFGLPPAEAMASGCYVVGYTGGGGDEFFDPTFSTPVHDQLGLARGVLEATARPLDELAALGAQASEFVLSRYADSGLREDLARTIGALVRA